MEFEYRDQSRRRGKAIIAFGVILALLTGGGAFYLVYQARQEAQVTGIELVPVVVARQTIPARKPIEAADVELRQVPAGPATEAGVFVDPSKVLMLVPTVTILPGQPVYANLLASGSTQSGFTILEPGETIAPGGAAWRAVSMTIPDDRAVGGLVHAGDIVDVFITAPIAVPEELAAGGRYTSDRATKITYQNLKILERVASYYVMRVDLAVAEEISHLQAVGSVSFSLALRPTEDNRTIDASSLGETTNRIIERYGLPIPEVYPGTGPVRQASVPAPSAAPSAPPDASPAVATPTP